MKGFENGVSGYVKAEATVTVFFPIDMKGNADISCRMCQFFNSNTNKCKLNDKVVEYPNQYVGSKCPLKVKEE